jgi:CheY-like chemotaxis protein
VKTRVRILVVDDFKTWRRLLESMLRTRPELEIISEASDGVEAVHKAEELQPDLILMDIGMPKRNGLEAARQIHRLCPQSKIIFFSQQMSADVVHEAFVSGASGYVVKVDAGTELLLAVDVVLRGERFVGRRFSGFAVPETRLPPTDSPVRHEVGFYSDDQFLLDHLTQFIGTALQAGRSAIVVATESHRESLFPRLQAFGVDVAMAIEEGRFIASDAATTVSSLIINGLPDRGRFFARWGSFIEAAAKATKRAHSRIAVFGECVQLLREQDNIEAALQIEKLCHELQTMHNIDILCGYSINRVAGVISRDILDRICREHSAVHYR